MSFLPAAAMALQAVGQVYGAVEENKALRRVATAEDENARLTELQGALDATGGLRESRQAMGADLAAMGSGGAALGGSITDMIVAQSIEAQMSALNTRFAAAGEAKQARQRASDARRAGKAALIKGVLGAAGTALQGASDIRQSGRLNATRAKSRAASIPGNGTSRTSKGGIPVPRAFSGGGGSYSGTTAAGRYGGMGPN